MEVDLLEKIDRFLEWLLHIFSLKRTKITLYIVAVLWLSLVTQIIMNRVFLQDLKIAEAFVKTNSEELECNLEIIAEHHMDFLSEEDKKNILYHLANAIDLKIDKDITISNEGDRLEYVYSKNAKMAETSLKIVSLEEEFDKAIKVKHYIVVRLNIKESIKSVERFRNLLDQALDEIGIEQRQVNVQYEGYVLGRLSLIDSEKMARLLVKDLQGELAFDYQQGNTYTVYAYTGLIDEYIETVGCKINIQIAMTYDEGTDKTKIYLASPILNQSW
jgi:hypothetical protein